MGSNAVLPHSYREYISIFDALSNPVRVKILGTLIAQRQYVSELARQVNISRPLLYMHLKKLEAANLVEGYHELSEDGKAIKYFQARPVALTITDDLLVQLAADIVIPDPAKDADS